MSSLRQSRAADTHRTGSTAQPLALSLIHFLLGLEGMEKKLCQFLGQGHSSVICSYLLQVVVLAASPRENEQAQTHSVSCLLSGVCSMGPLTQLWYCSGSGGIGQGPSLLFNFFSLFAEDTGERLVSAVRILPSPPADEHRPLLPAPGERLASGTSVVCAEQANLVLVAM